MSRARSVAVVGGGIFGATAAVELARAGCRVDLFDRNPDLLRAASGINQFRLHRGYHYPRSLDTALSCKKSEATFRAVYGGAVRDDVEHFYAIARHNSLTSVESFVDFCAALDLEHTTAAPAVLKQDRVGLCVRVRESLFDVDALREICRRDLERTGVEVHLGRVATLELLEHYDFNVVATYAYLNELLGIRRPQRFQFEVCEKPVVRLPPSFRKKSIVVLDGPFMCIDPMGSGDLFVMGNVVHAIHARNVGELPKVPETVDTLLNAGIVRTPATKFPLFIRAAMEFFSDVEHAEHVGSMFTIRAVLPGMDLTDGRPTLVERIDDRIVTIFSGKITTCVDAARDVVAMLEGTEPAARQPARSTRTSSRS